MRYVLRDVDISLSAWLAGFLPSGANIVFDPPDRQQSAATPALGVYLHDVREEAEATPAGWSNVRSEDGHVIGHLPPQLRYRLIYLITAWADDPLTEHEILGNVLAGCALHQTIPADSLRGCLVDSGQQVIIRCAPFQRGCDPQALWAAWRMSPRTALELSALAPLPVAALTTAPPPPRKLDLHSAPRPPIGTAGPTPGRRARIDEH